MVECILEQGSSKRYRSAARNMRHSASVAGPVTGEGEIESHDAFVARLKREHGGKYSFWQLIETE